LGTYNWRLKAMTLTLSEGTVREQFQTPRQVGYAVPRCMPKSTIFDSCSW
jgi:hypothetical protein